MTLCSLFFCTSIWPAEKSWIFYPVTDRGSLQFFSHNSWRIFFFSRLIENFFRTTNDDQLMNVMIFSCDESVKLTIFYSDWLVNFMIFHTPDWGNSHSPPIPMTDRQILRFLFLSLINEFHDCFPQPPMVPIWPWQTFSCSPKWKCNNF